MNWKLGVAGLVAGLAFVSVQGCAADSAPMDEGDQEEAASTEDELSANASRLVGAFHGAGGTVPPTFEGIVFKLDGTFIADLDTGIRCIMAPCPSGAHLVGKYSATKNYLRLTAKTPGGEGEAFYGRYRYTLSTNGKNLHLSSHAGLAAGWSNDLSKKISYCNEPSDCAGQGLIVPACVGSFTCGSSASNAHQCGFKCGVPANQIWPSNATKLVAESAGGGFTPPPPPGSTCRIGAAKYSLDLATKKLDWQSCDWRTDGAPLTMKTGSTTVTAAEMTKINAAMNAVKLADGDICGADKPLMTISVSTASSTKTYTDSFYSCWGGDRTFIDNIGGVFTAMRNAAE